MFQGITVLSFEGWDEQQLKLPVLPTVTLLAFIKAGRNFFPLSIHNEVDSIRCRYLTNNAYIVYASSVSRTKQKNANQVKKNS